jgi:hypothetical protein
MPQGERGAEGILQSQDARQHTPAEVRRGSGRETSNW